MELIGVKKHNKNLEYTTLKKEEEKKKLVERCQELINQKCQIKQASGWPNGLVGGQTHDLG